MRRAKSRDSERGSAVLIVGVWTVLLLFLGMSIDYGIILRYRRAMQNACDAGVMSGGLDLKTNPGVVVPKTMTYASNDLKQNNIGWDTLTAQTLDANGTPTGTNPVQDRAYIHATVPTYFYRLVVPSVPVAIECSSRIVPVSKTGLQPVGTVYNQWVPIWTQLQKNPCPLIGTPTSQMTPIQQQYCTTDAQLTVGVNNNTYGSGNTGTLDLSNPTACSGTGNSAWACVFENGTGTGTGTPPPPYCANQVDSNGNGVTPWPACSIAQTRPGVGAGSANGNTGLDGAIYTLCSTPNPLNADGTVNNASKWIVIVPLLDPLIWGPGGSGVTGKATSIDIVGFTAFELDCLNPNMPGPLHPNAKFTGGNATIYGLFVSVMDKQAISGCVPTPQNQTASTCVDTGVETLILVE